MNIALVGTAPSSRMLAPYKDKDWEIWACGPANVDVLPRCDAWFEIHDIKALEVDASWTPYLAWVTMQPKVYGIDVDPRFKGMVRYPIEDMTKEFGHDFWNSSLSYMAALAISQKPEAIGFWGVDMSAGSEYIDQRPGCKHFIQVARSRGIEVVIPPESDLDAPQPMYGYREMNPMWKKLNIRRAEMSDRLNMLSQQRAAADQEINAINGALETLDNVLMTWG